MAAELLTGGGVSLVWLYMGVGLGWGMAYGSNLMPGWGPGERERDMTESMQHMIVISLST